MEREANAPTWKLSKKLNKIRVELKVGKGHRNDFGKFNYRSSEDIMAAAKPLLDENDCLVTVDRQVFFMESAFFIEATASFFDGEALIQARGYARIPQSKAGMDDSQVTGSATSYADKFALQALFLLDDGNFDPDGMNNNQQRQVSSHKANRSNQGQKQSDGKSSQPPQDSTQSQKITSNQKGKIKYLLKKNPALEPIFNDNLASIGCAKIEDLGYDDAEMLIGALNQPMPAEKKESQEASSGKITANLVSALLKSGYNDQAAREFIDWAGVNGYSEAYCLDHLPGLLKIYEDAPVRTA